MPKAGKKLTVYLDQNFISHMAKADIDNRVRKDFTDLFNVLHEGFLSEKLVVVSSWFHKIETSLLPEDESYIRERIENYRAWMGQINLKNLDDIYSAQLNRSLKDFKNKLCTDIN